MNQTTIENERIVTFHMLFVVVFLQWLFSIGFYSNFRNFAPFRIKNWEFFLEKIMISASHMSVNGFYQLA